jgi:hypothetical protein
VGIGIHVAQSDVGEINGVGTGIAELDPRIELAKFVRPSGDIGCHDFVDPQGRKVWQQRGHGVGGAGRGDGVG